MANGKPVVHLPSLTRHVTSEHLSSIKSSISKCQIACLSVAQTNVNKPKIKLKEDSFFPVSPDDQSLAVTKYQGCNTLPFFIENDHTLPKPKLLEDLEKFLEKELQILKVTDNEYNELTFLAHREVFEYLIDNFKTYKPLLSRIKNRYERRMHQLKKQIHSMKPLKQMAATTAERYEHKIMALREQDKQRLIELQSTHREFSEKLSSLLKSHHDAEYSIKRLKKEIENMHLQYQEQAHQRYFIVNEMNDLRLQMEKLEEAKNQRQEDPQEDPITLRAAIRAAREREKISSQKINEMNADYSDLIPQPQYAELEEKYQAISENCEKIMNEFKALKKKHSDLLAINLKLTDERNFYYLECEKLKKTEIAMDHWNKCIDFINGGQTNWQEVSSGASCQALLETLQEMVTQNIYIATLGNIATEPTLFTGLGLDPKVPKFLRYEGEVQGRRMFVRDCYLMVADIWETRMKDTQTERKPLVEFLDDYLQQIIPNADERVKWAYTFNAACQKLAQNYDNVNLFLEIINGNADENIYYARQGLSSNLLVTLLEAEKRRQEEKEKEMGEATAEQPAAGSMTRDEFSQELMQFFGITSPEDTSFLLKAALQQLQTQGNIEYAKLFILDDEGEFGPFLTAVKDWQHEKQTEFINQLRQSVHSSSINVSHFKKALHKVGPHLSNRCIDKLVSWVFESSAPEVTLPANEVLSRLNTTFIPVIKKQVPKA